MITLSKKQVKFLKQVAHHHKPIFQMGKLGLTDVFIEQVDQALEKRELVKFNILQNSEEEIKEATAAIAEAVEAVVVQVIGHTGILYRPSSKPKNQGLSKEVADVK